MAFFQDKAFLFWPASLPTTDLQCRGLYMPSVPWEVKVVYAMGSRGACGVPLVMFWFFYWMDSHMA